MKKIIAIFSVILTFGLGVSTDGWSGGCRPHACGDNHTDDDKVYLSGPQKCFFCQNGYADEDECDGGHVVVDSSNNLHVCNDNSSDTWSTVTNFNSAKLSNGSLNLAAKGTTNTEYCWVQSKDSDICSKNVSVAKVQNNASDTEVLAADIFLYIYCTNGTVPAENGKSCVTPNYEQVCTDSHGQWNNNTCTCDFGLGLVNTDPNVPSSPCKCSNSSHIWNGTECVDPDQSTIDACENQPSGGEWSNGQCDCTDVEPEKKQSPARMTCVENTKFTNCDNSHGDWNGGANGTCTCDETNKGLVLRGEVCVCKDADAIWNGRDKCETSPRALCEGTGGTFIPSQSDPNNGTCNCEADPDKNLKNKTGVTPERCECKSPDYEWNADRTQGCKLSPEAENRKENFEKSKEACEAWRGTWSPETWESPDGVDVTKWKCECPNSAGVVQATAVSCKCDTINGYQETAPNTCTQTTCSDLQTKCNAVRDASYRIRTAHGGQEYCECVCDDEKNKAYNYSKNKCEAITNICDFIDGAIPDRYGNCICESNLLPPVRGKCPSGTSSGSASGGGASSGVTVSPQEIARAKQKVSDVYDDLKSISDGFGRSHWKTASGNFNGARLASDSIAGVVLGTVGGVVTSNVIKKNQVKGGFESLQCTVGGQLVADFADQFQVGIR